MNNPVTTKNRRIKLGNIFERENFNRLPGAINWRRKGDADSLVSLDLNCYLEHIKNDAMMVLK